MFNPKTKYQLAPGTTYTFAKDGSLKLTAPGVPVFSVHKITAHALAHFQQGRTIAEAAQWLVTISSTQEINCQATEITAVLLRLIRAGILISTKNTSDAADAVRPSYNRVQSILSCLNDRSRTLVALDAIRKVVKPGHIVIDIGTNSGIFAVAAAQAGAAKVYALEPSEMAGRAKALIKANKMESTVEVIQKTSQRFQPPQLADVIISELISHDPFGENVLDVLQDAQKRFLKPSGKSIPEKLRVFLQVHEVPDSYLHRLQITPTLAEKWSADYDIDFNSLQNSGYDPEQTRQIKQSSACSWPPLSNPVCVCEIDFNNELLEPEGSNTWRTEIQIQEPSNKVALLSYFEIEYATGTVYSNAPRLDIGATMRRNRYKLLNKPVTKDQHLAVEFQRTGSRSVFRALP